jgi:hypothetical protein
MTEEERKEYRREHNRKYRLANKEKLDAYRKENADYFKAYGEANKEKIRVNKQAYYKANKEILTSKARERYISKRDGMYTVYYLPTENYVGMTSNLNWRLRGHKSKHDRFVKDVEIFGKYETKRQALDVESELHSLGYAGANPKHQQLNN